MNLDSVSQTLEERGRRYGDFAGHATITRALKDLAHNHPAWAKLADDQREALDMIAHKIGRILNGDPNYADSWIDIAGYAKLVADRLEVEAEADAMACVANSEDDDKNEGVIHFATADHKVKVTITITGETPTGEDDLPPEVAKILKILKVLAG